MKLSTNTVLLLFGIIGLGLLQSCKDDNEDPTPSPSAPNTLTFSNIDHTEFKMWTNGGEVNTNGLSIAAYMDSDEYNHITSEYYQSHAGFTFNNDSLFSEMNGMIEGYPYHISNDSIYVTVSFPVEGQDPVTFDQYIAMGNTAAFYIPQSYFKTIINSGMFTVESSTLEVGHFTFDELAEETGLNSVADIQENDTLIIYNQRVHYN